MSLEQLRVVVLMYRRDGRPLEDSALASIRTVDPERVRFNGGRTTASVELSAVRASDFSNDEAGSVALEAAMEQSFVTAAEWLEGRAPASFDELRAAGYMIDIWLFPQISDDQFEFNAPPRFLAACGARGLALKLITND